MRKSTGRTNEGISLAEEGFEHDDEPRARCYAEHADEEDTLICVKQHMRYDKIKNAGIFGEGIICRDCGVIDPLEVEDP